MNEVKEQEVLTKIRTLLALERNSLAEERTVIAKFRTGLALILIGPTMSTIIAVLLSVLNVNQSIVIDVLNFTFFSILIIFGVWTIFRSQSKLKKIWKNKIIIKSRIIEISKSSKNIYNLLSDLIEYDNLPEDLS
ncbi:hypothetical protein ACFLRN_06370 [Thermoproteota archaeon]